MSSTSEVSFGKYTVLERIGRGGMAEVYRCKRSGIGGFEKTVVIKRILEEFAAEPEFVRMFLDEARLVSQLSHPNIVHVYEIDEADGCPYIVMEFVRGPTLRALLRTAQRAKDVRWGHFARIISQVCQGLHYAHQATDAAGEPLGIIHRDVSPQNILVAYDGSPKLLDFGIAKAKGRLSNTEAGTFKGKIRYTAPEQLKSLNNIDRRVDVYAAGACLFEACTGRALYESELESELLLQIPSGPKQWPIDFIPNFPKELDQIIRWALHPEPEHRCPTAQKLHEALESFIEGTPHKSESLVGYVKKLCPEGVKLPGEDTTNLPGGVKRGSGSHSSATVGSGRRVKPKAKTSPWSAVAWGAGLAALCALSALWLLRPSSAPAQGPAVQAALEASSAERRATQSAALKAYLDEIEKQAAAKQFGEALYLMSKARLLEDTEVALQIRMATLGYRIERDALLSEARRHLAAGDAEAAWHVARQVLDKDPENEEVVTLLREARAKLGGRIPSNDAVR